MKANLLIAGEERNLFSYTLHADRIIRSIDSEKYINYLNRKTTNLYNDRVRIFSHWDVTKGGLLGWMIDLRIESTSNDGYFHEWLTEMDGRNGEIFIPWPTDEDTIMRHIRFKGAWATDVGDHFSGTSADPLMLNLRIVAP